MVEICRSKKGGKYLKTHSHMDFVNYTNGRLVTITTACYNNSVTNLQIENGYLEKFVEEIIKEKMETEKKHK